MPSPAAQLLDGLDRHIELLKSLVDLSQREQQHLIAFEPKAMVELTEAKAGVAIDLQASEGSLREALEALANEVNLPEDQELTMTAVIALTRGQDQVRLHERASLVRALAENLRELQAVSLVHAERGVKLVQQYTSLLRRTDAEPTSGTYTAQGRTAKKSIPTKTLSRTV